MRQRQAGQESGAVLEVPGLGAGLDDPAVMGEAIKQGGGHSCVTEDGGPFAEDEVGGDDDDGISARHARAVTAASAVQHRCGR